MHAGQDSVLRLSGLPVAISVDDGFAVFILEHIFVGEAGIFEKRGNGVEAEAGHAALQPEADDVLEGLVDLGVVPVQVGLLDIELVVVVLAGLFVPLPRRVAEARLPVVGRLALVGGRLALAVAPDVPVAIGVGARGARLQEPLVLVGGMVHHHVHDDADVALAGFGDQTVEVGQCPILRDRCSCSRRCRSRSPPAARDSRASARWRRRRAPSGNPAAAVIPFRSPTPSPLES